MSNLFYAPGASGERCSRARTTVIRSSDQSWTDLDMLRPYVELRRTLRFLKLTPIPIVDPTITHGLCSCKVADETVWRRRFQMARANHNVAGLTSRAFVHDDVYA